MSRRGTYRNYYHENYPRSTPIKTEGGIKIRKRGEIGNKWWSSKLISILTSYGWDARLDRGKRYARSGQVLRIEIGNGKIDAEVQGSRSTPYKISIDLPVVTERVWDTILSSMKKRPEFTSALLSGNILPELEDVFRESGSPIFPSSGNEIKMKCSCPDYANPCKHIAAVFYVLADSFDDDPFLLIQLKGKTKDEILKSLTTLDTEADHIPESQVKNEGDKVSDELLLKFWKLSTVSVKMEHPGSKHSVSPIEKYPLPSDFADDAVWEILRKYYLEIENGVRLLEQKVKT